ncbi:MAG: fumarate reductase subunit D [Planctomycetota bacterium]|nr:fumarate reductase subunit D [Planctomycetota bacterium]
MAKSNEPIWWSLFSAGGVVAAFFMPITVVLTCIAVPAGWISAEGLRQLVEQPLTRLYLFVLISLPMFHWAHRFRYVAVDLGLKGLGSGLMIACYGTAGLGTVMAVFFLTW